MTPRLPAGADRRLACTESLKILLVEDGKANQIMAMGMLKKWGHHVTLPKNGEQAVQRWQQERLRSDPDGCANAGDGRAGSHTSYSRLEKGNAIRHVPIVAMTAHAMKGDRERCIQAGMDGYVAKPFRKHELYKVLRELFASVEQPTEDTKYASAESTSPHIDWQRALEMVAGEPEVLNDVATAASGELLDLLNTLEQSVSQQDFSTAQRAAHTIKSSSKILAARELVELSAAAELAAIEHDMLGMEAALTRLRSLVPDVVRDIDAYLASAERSNQSQ